MTGDDYIRLRCIASFETFVRHFFAHQYGRKFIVSAHHRQIIEALTEVVAGRCQRLIINMPPRYGKTELAVKMFMAYGLALNPQAHFVHLSYSDDLARDNSETVRSLLMTDEWRRIFPYIRLSKSSRSKKKWMTEDGGGVYATSTGGQITGFGAGVVDEDAELEDEVRGVSERSVFGGAIIIDDPMKPEDALSDTRRERINQRFETTIRSRVNSRSTPIVIIMQRLHRNDLAGYLLESEPSEWRVLSLPAITQEQGQDAPLWEFKHNLQELYRLREINRYVFETQYMQNPMPLEGLLYDAGRWREYQVQPIGRMLRRCMVDTADTGSDYLCAICYDETEQGAYVTDVLFTQESMDTTEDMLARMLVAHGTEQCDIEVVGRAEIHGIEGVEITAVEYDPKEMNRIGDADRTERRFAAQLTETHCRYLAESHTENGVKKLFTFLDGDEFLQNWGFGKDNCGNETHIAPKGLIKKQGDVVTTAKQPFMLDVVGRYEVRINGKVFDTVCVIDAGAYEEGVVTEQYLDRSGKTILWRRFNRNDWMQETYKRLWTELLPENERITVDGATYVHWYDCITDYIL